MKAFGKVQQASLRGGPREAGKRLLSLVARNPYGWQAALWAWQKVRSIEPHWIDAQYGINTSESLPPYLIQPGAPLDGEIVFHLGCEPDCVRRALDALPLQDPATFLDLGCGMGRALVVASEYNFTRIVGVDLSSYLCRTARQNADVVAQQFPERTRIEVIEADATEVDLPGGPLVVFLYNPFGRQTLAKVLSRLEAASATRLVNIVYQNPVGHDLIDASPHFRRWEHLSCQAHTRSAEESQPETIVVWRSDSLNSEQPLHGACDIVLADDAP